MKKKEYILQITSGRGPIECCWVVSQVLSLIIDEVKQYGISYVDISREKGIEADTLLSASIKISGSGARDLIKSWEGSILWIGQSPYRKFHKRKNWFIGVNSSTISESNTICVKDIYYQALKSSGPGGQHVNKVSTAVRAIHKPTGLTVLASDTRSQMQNKKLATQRLLELYKQRKFELMIQKQQNLWCDHNSLNRCNPIRTYKGREFISITKKEKQLE